MGDSPYPDLVEPVGDAYELAKVIARYDAQILRLTMTAAFTRRRRGGNERLMCAIQEIRAGSLQVVYSTITFPQEQHSVAGRGVIAYLDRDAGIVEAFDVRGGNLQWR